MDSWSLTPRTSVHSRTQIRIIPSLWTATGATTASSPPSVRRKSSLQPENLIYFPFTTKDSHSITFLLAVSVTNSGQGAISLCRPTQSSLDNAPQEHSPRLLTQQTSIALFQAQKHLIELFGMPKKSNDNYALKKATTKEGSNAMQQTGNKKQRDMQLSTYQIARRAAAGRRQIFGGSAPSGGGGRR